MDEKTNTLFQLTAFFSYNFYNEIEISIHDIFYNNYY